jgi:hypothetical protein
LGSATDDDVDIPNASPYKLEQYMRRNGVAEEISIRNIAKFTAH